MGGENQRPLEFLVEPLTRRESEILSLLGQNLSNQEIADTLILEVTTIKWHLQHIYGKLGVNSRRQALVRARELGLLASPIPLGLGTPTPKHNLPDRLSSFVGRGKEIACVLDLLGNSRLLTLTGAGGVGKSRLALQCAREALDRFSHGTWLVELASLSDPSLVLQTVAAVFRVRENPEVSLFTALMNFYREKNLLLVLDNCEHLVDTCARLSERLLQNCEGLSVLVTSREALGVGGEAVYVVPPLGCPTLDCLLPVESLVDYEAIRLFAERARAVMPDFRISQENATQVAQICHRLDGIPLAIELAAARLKVFEIGEIAARLDDSFRLLTGGSRTALPRYQTMHASIDWSYHLLSQEEQVFSRRLSVFAGGWTLEAAEKICGADARKLPGDRDVQNSPSTASLEPDAILDLLTALVNKSLVSVRQEAGKDTRYWMLETIRKYAGDKLVESGKTEWLLDRHLAYFLELSEEAEKKIHSGERLKVQDRLEAEKSNLRVALNRASSAKTKEKALICLRIVCASFGLWNQQSSYAEAKEWLESGLAVIGEDPQYNPLRAQVLWLIRNLDNFSFRDYRIGDIDTELISLIKTSGDWKLNLVFMRAHANDTYTRGKTQAAFDEIKECVEIARSRGDPWYLAFMLERQGLMAIQEHQPEGKLYIEECIALYEGTGDRWSAGFPLIQRGNYALIVENDYEAALAYFHMGGKRCQEIQDQMGFLISQFLQASVYFFQKKYHQMQVQLQKSLTIAQEISDLFLEIHSARRLGIAHLHLGDWQEASKYFLEFLSTAQKRAEILDMILGIEGLATVGIAVGQPARGARLLGAVEALVAKHTRRLYVEEQAEFDHWRTEAAAQLNEAVFAASWAEGQALTLEQALLETKTLADELLAK